MATTKKRGRLASSKGQENNDITSEDNNTGPVKKLKQPPLTLGDDEVNDDAQLMSQVATHSYSTRRKTIDLDQLGLKKRTQTEISASAQCKRAKKDAVEAEKLQVRNAKDRKQKEGIQQLKEIEAKRLQEYVSEEVQMQKNAAAAYLEEIDTDARQIANDFGDKTHSSGSEFGLDGNQSSDEDTDYEGSKESASVNAKSQKTPKKHTLTSTQKKHAHAQSLRDAIAPERQLPVPILSVTSNRVKKAQSSSDGLVSNWCDRISSQMTPNAPQLNTSSNQTPSWKDQLQGPNIPAQTFKNQSHKSIASLTGSANFAARKNSAEEVGGLCDDDVVTQKGAVVNASMRHKQIVEVFGPESNGNDAESHTKGCHKSKTPRKPKTIIEPEKSISTNSLPSWIEPFFWTAVMPTVRDIYGGLEDPWDINQQETDYFISVLQQAVDAACPQQHHTLSKSDQIYRIACQQIYEWHRDFLKAAIKAVRDGITEHCGKNATVDEIKGYVIAALAPGGDAYNGTPVGKTTRRPYYSPFLLKTFVSHLLSIRGSRSEQAVYPVGALALSMASVQLAFRMYATGKFIAGEGFSKVTAGALTLEYTGGQSFEQLLAKSSRFDAIIEAALRYVHAPRPDKKGNVFGLQAVQLDVYSSPPGSPTKEW
ncbi:hypothetical protein BJ138DRAFT_1236217 [Hygrophoropsis aurantiaca]|uniref:Uncharacterized protein n=1 Tax=Hygrophoropsis aurantiaca TaxID=72124 RepID=A0ACB7ZV06_9AGAM|nr:hypothetical protein BJ138DRAFT_1236217 [Hygrophoropsis aurantiaca]